LKDKIPLKKSNWFFSYVSTKHLTSATWSVTLTHLLHQRLRYWALWSRSQAKGSQKNQNWNPSCFMVVLLFTWWNAQVLFLL